MWVVTAIVGLVAASLLSSASAAVDVTVTADLSGSGVTWASKFMLDCVGASHGEMYMWEDNRNHLRAIARDIGFKHVRGHGLLDDDLSTYLNGAANMWNLHSICKYRIIQTRHCPPPPTDPGPNRNQSQSTSSSPSTCAPSLSSALLRASLPLTPTIR
jgi:Glycosyl hydrolases family 39